MATARAATGSDVIIGVNQRDRAVAISVAESLGVPAILSVQNQHNFWGPLVVPQLKRAYYARTLRNSEALCVCTSDAVKAEILEMGVPEARCRVLHNGVEVERYATDPGEVTRVRGELGIGPDDVMLVNVGRLDIQKAQDLLLAAWARSDRPPGSRLVLVGDTTDGSQQARSGRFKEDLLAARAALPDPDSVLMLGWRDDVQALLSAADGYVHSARWEGWPLTVVEAMSASLPFIMTDCSGRPNGYVENGPGLMVSTGDVDELADAISELVAMTPEGRAAMGAKAHQLATEHYDIDVVGANFASMVEELASGTKRNSA
jgi:glycosyltransferase involved in cell wall biosynthesis